jgi:hypothetical protein
VSSEPLIRFVAAVPGRIKGGHTPSVGPSWKHTCEIKICLWFLEGAFFLFYSSFRSVVVGMLSN